MLLAILIVMALTADTRIASAAPGGAEQGVAPPPATGEVPFDRQGMWIWYVDRSDGGSVGRILARARGAGIGTVDYHPSFPYSVFFGPEGATVNQPQMYWKAIGTSVRAFQASKGLPVDGVLGTTTWSSLLDFDPVRPRWAGRRAKRGGGATASRRPGAFPPRRPLSASLPAKAYEIDPGPAP